MWKIKNVLVSLKTIVKVFIITDVITEALTGDDTYGNSYYLIPIIEWEDDKNVYDYEIILNDDGNIIDYSWSYETKKDIEGMFQ